VVVELKGNVAVVLMAIGQVFVSFADGRNLENAMDEPQHTPVVMADDAHQKQPLMALEAFDFQHYTYKPPTLLQQIVIYLRIKASTLCSRVVIHGYCTHIRRSAFVCCCDANTLTCAPGSRHIPQQSHHHLRCVHGLWPHHPRQRVLCADTTPPSFMF